MFSRVCDLDPDGSRFYLLPGFRIANRLGFIETEHAWGGKANKRVQFGHRKCGANHP